MGWGPAVVRSGKPAKMCRQAIELTLGGGGLGTGEGEKGKGGGGGKIRQNGSPVAPEGGKRELAGGNQRRGRRGVGRGGSPTGLPEGTF